MSQTDAPSEPVPAAVSVSPSIRWWPGVLILLLFIAAIVIIRLASPDDATQQVRRIYPAIGLTLIGMTAWWLLFSRAKWPLRIGVLVAVGAGIAIFNSQYKIVDVDGSAWPILQHRSEKTKDELAAEYFDRQLSNVKQATSEADDSEQTRSGVLMAEPVVIAESDWPGFRGSRNDGIVENLQIDTDWKSNPPVEVWRHPVGRGWGAFAVADGLAITQEQHGQQESVVAYELETGKPVWLYADEVRFDSSMGGDGPRATPTIVADAVYTLGATGILNCLDVRTGKLFWSRNILADAKAPLLDWGMSTSPLVTDDYVYAIPGGKSGRSVICYDRRTGEPVWTSGNHPASYCAPRIELLDGVATLLVFDGRGLSGYDPQTGEEWWRFPWETDYEINVAQPIVREGKYVLISSGYTKGSALLKVTKGENGKFPSTPEVVWKKSNFFKSKFNDPVYLTGSVYGFDEGILASIDYKTGKRNWKRGRYGYGQMLLLKPQNLLMVISERPGDLILVDADPDKFTELSRISAVEGKTWNPLTIAGEYVIVRNSAEAVCFRLPVKK